MLSAKKLREFGNSRISTPLIDTSRPSRDPCRSFKSQPRGQNSHPRFNIVLPSLVYPYFELDIHEQDEIHKPSG